MGQLMRLMKVVCEPDQAFREIIRVIFLVAKVREDRSEPGGQGQRVSLAHEHKVPGGRGV